MNDLARILTMLAATRPSIELGDLLINEPSATFEQHLPADDGGRDIWIYTVNGATLDGDCIVVRARIPIEAETMAQEGLAATVASLKNFDANTGLHAEVTVQ